MKVRFILAICLTFAVGLISLPATSSTLMHPTQGTDYRKEVSAVDNYWLHDEIRPRPKRENKCLQECDREYNMDIADCNAAGGSNEERSLCFQAAMTRYSSCRARC